MLFTSIYGADPFSDIRRLQREMNRVFEGYSPEPEDFPVVNVWSNKDELLVTAEIPGVDPKDISISVNQDILTIEGDRKSEELQERVVCHRSERGAGRFVRALRLPFDVESDKVKARHKLGVLTITMPRAEASKPKKIAINAE